MKQKEVTFKFTLTQVKILNSTVSISILVLFILLLKLWISAGDIESLPSLFLFSLPLLLTLILLGIFCIIATKQLKKQQSIEIEKGKIKILTLIILPLIVIAYFLRKSNFIFFLAPLFLLIIVLSLGVIIGNFYFKRKSESYVKIVDASSKAGQLGYNKISYLLSKWWLYPILWFLCILALMFIGYYSGADVEILSWKAFLALAVALPMGLVFFGIPVFSQKIPQWSIPVGYYLLYIAAFSVLPFIKGKWKKILIAFLLLWLFLAFFGCAIGMSMLSGGSDW